jgi:predicted MFS family arabinose efflux permease
MGADGVKNWQIAAVLGALLALHNAQRMAPVPLVDELRTHLATDYVGVGNLFGAYLLTYALFTIPAGLLSDRVDSKRLVTAGAALSLLGALLFAFAGSYAVAVIARLALGIAGALLYVPAVRFVVTVFPQENRGAVMGVVEMGAGAGTVFSLALLPVLAGWLNLARSFLCLAVLAVLTLLAVMLRFPEGKGRAAERGAPVRAVPLFRQASFRHFSVFHFLGMLAVYAALGWLPTYYRTHLGFSPVEAGLVSGLVTVALALASPMAGWASDRIGARSPILLVGSLLCTACFAVFLMGGPVALLMGATFLVGVGMAMTIPIVMVLVGESFALGRAGTAVSIVGTVGQISSSLSGPVFGYALQAGGFAAVWGLALILSLGRIPFLLLAGEPRGKRPPETMLKRRES